MTLETAQTQPSQKVLPRQPETKTNDFEFSPELEAQDPYFNRKMQEVLHRQLKNFEAGNYHDHDLIEVSEDA